MAAGTIPIKTPQGQAELSTRQRRVSQRHRTVLFLIDGKRSAIEVRRMALQAGVPEHCFDELLEMGLIMLPEPTFSLLIDTPADLPDVLHVDLPLGGSEEPAPAGAAALPAATAVPDSVLPASRTLYPTLSADSGLGDPSVADAWLPFDAGLIGNLEPAVAEARLILLRAVRAEAPLAGSLTMLRLRRARTRADLDALLDEVEARITRPHRALAASLTMQRVRTLLGPHIGPSMVTA